MKRRTFFKLSSLASVPVVVQGLPVQSFFSTGLMSSMNNVTDRVLVLIQLNGGNDGLSMLPPLDQYSNLSTLRSPVLVPQASAIQLNSATGLHPAMTDLHMAWNNGYVQFIQGVGYPNQNRSHFRSQDIWITASQADQFLNTGWMGRYFDHVYPGYPDGFPNIDNPDPIAITIGNNISETCQGVNGNYSLSVIDPSTISPLDDPNLEPVPNNCYGMELTFLRDAVKQTNQYNDTIKAAAQKGNNLSTKYNANYTLSQKLKTVARLISGGLQTKVYVVSQGGYDTHAAQVNSSDKTKGTHANLLAELSNAICAFQDDCVQLGIDQKVIGMTFSEFGRRIKTNGSGTDHGSAAPMILFGSCINPILLGNNPVIAANTTDLEGVAMQYDFRSVYGSIMNQWFKVGADTVKNLVWESYQDLPVILGCDTTSNFDPQSLHHFHCEILNNPCGDTVQLIIKDVRMNQYRIELFNELGGLIQKQNAMTSAELITPIKMNLEGMSSGVYFVRVSDVHHQQVVRVLKM